MVVMVLLAAVLMLNVSRGPDWTGALEVSAGGGVPGGTYRPPGCVPRPAGLISWWPGDRDANDIVDGNDGTLQNGATFTAGKVKQAFSFDGVDDFVEAPTSGFPTGSSDRTLELWARIDAAVSGEAFFAGYGAFESLGQTYFLGTVGTTLFFSNWGEALWGPTLDTGQWYHVAVTNIEGMLTLYLNGEAVSTATWPAESINIPAGTMFYIGKAGPADDYRKLQGSVDEVSLYNRALSAEEILAIYMAGHQGKCRMPPMLPIPRS
jgi:hypothetical protein